MPSEWVATTLGEVVNLKRGFDLPAQQRLPGKVPIISSSGVSDFHSECKVKGPGVVTGRYGTIGKVYFTEEDFFPLNTTLYVESFKGNDPRFIYYFLQTIDYFKYSDKAAVPGVNRNHLHTAQVLLPGIEEQRHIVAILKPIDDKIALLRDTNATLETIAQALFKSWFVNFDPVRAKAEGRDTEGVSPEVADMFPSEFEDSELGMIPKGWRVGILKDLTTKIGSGATPRGGKDVYVTDGIAFVRSQNVYDSEFIWDGLAWITSDQAEALSNVDLQLGDVLLNITGASILRTCVVDPNVLPARVNQHVAIIRPKAGVPNRYLHQHMLRKSTKDYLMGMNAGASREAVTKAHIESVPILVPPAELLGHFQTITEPGFARIESGAAEIRSLADLRDTLLPRLMSGKLRIWEMAGVLE